MTTQKARATTKRCVWLKRTPPAGILEGMRAPDPLDLDAPRPPWLQEHPAALRSGGGAPGPDQPQLSPPAWRRVVDHLEFTWGSLSALPYVSGGTADRRRGHRRVQMPPAWWACSPAGRGGRRGSCPAQAANHRHGDDLHDVEASGVNCGEAAAKRIGKGPGQDRPAAPPLPDRRLVIPDQRLRAAPSPLISAQCPASRSADWTFKQNFGPDTAGLPQGCPAVTTPHGI
jgi:hypothetical protein